MENLKDENKDKKTSKTNKRTILFFSFICYLIFFFLLEAFLRTTHIFNASLSCSQPDRVISYRYVPGCHYWCNQENDHPITGKYNSYGWRDKERTLKKRPGTYRIAVLGDSYVEALQVEFDRTFLALTEKQLNKDGIKVELMNFGRSGFTQTEELLVLTNDVVKFLPDMVILFFEPNNDIEEVSNETALDLMRPFFKVQDNGELNLDTTFAETSGFKIRSLINEIKINSAIISFVMERYNVIRKSRMVREKERIRDKEIKKPNRLFGPLSLSTNNPDPRYFKNYTLNKILIKKMSDFCQRRGIHFMLVTNDNHAYIPQTEERYRSIDPSYDMNYFEDDLRKYSKLLYIEYLGLQRIFRQFYLREGTPLHWGHWNYRGHEVVADALTKKLKILSDKPSTN